MNDEQIVDTILLCIDNNNIIGLTENLSKLTILDIPRKNLNDNDARLLAKALEINQTLTTIDIAENNISNLGAVELAKALEINRTLTTIDMADNNISNLGAVKLAKALEINSTLIMLSIGLNNIGIKGVTAFAKMLEINKTLIALRINDNYDICTDGVMLLVKAFEINRTLTTLDICNHYILSAYCFDREQRLNEMFEKYKLNLISELSINLLESVDHLLNNEDCPPDLTKIIAEFSVIFEFTPNSFTCIHYYNCNIYT
jgi:Ran GTPase-activating protein (RanGAP) involved in mRNA processing and transport